MHYLSAEGLSKSYGIKPLFTGISFNIHQGDKIALVAPNGSGKSSLLRVIAGREQPDEGKLWIHKEVRIAFLEQEPQLEEEKSVLDNIFSHNHPVLNAVKAYESCLASPETNDHQMREALRRIDELSAWNIQHVVHEALTMLRLEQLSQKVSALSGGQRRRLSLAKTLLDYLFSPENTLLILDEPTNHLDFDMIEWLADFLSDEHITLLMVSHDRYFIDTVCSEIWELEQAKLYVHKGDYTYYLEKKALREASEAAGREKAKNLYRKELEWMRRQPKARTTKSKSRTHAFYNLEEKLTESHTRTALQLEAKMSRLGGKILEMKKVYKSFGDKVILKGFDYTFKRGERVGIIGKNGTGKSTFLNLVTGVESPDSGKINIGETVVFGYFSQQGISLKEDMRVIEYVKSIAEFFPLADGAKVMASEFLQRFLFTPEQQFTYISNLSGGEKKRLQLLSVLYKNPNFLILDEPTNDLDLPTLQALEEFLEEFEGCLLMVSHDRYFMDKLIDHLFIFEGNGKIEDFPGNYTQYRKEKNLLSKTAASKLPLEKKQNTDIKQKEEKPRKLSYKEKLELEKLNKEIPELERRKNELNTRIVQECLPYEQLQSLLAELEQVVVALEASELRWLELSELQD
ncbi:MAG: ABC-F family ATP-binding cassette domain-containing protein [Chitinophagales bacterium]|nr:ABC-F family ATP-binding cassette domain-containing protein [Chitinophagales bacterium]